MIVARRAVLAALACLTLTLVAVPSATASAAPETVTCGEAITHSIVIANDLSGCGFGKAVMTVGADHITIDLNGHSFGGIFAPPLSSTGHSYVTIENGTLEDNAIALPLSGDHHDTVRNVTALGGGEGAGIWLKNGSDNTVVDSTVSGGPVCCLAFELNGENNDLIAGNTTLGLQINGGADNQVTRNRTPGMDVAGSGNLIEGNTLSASGARSDGLVISGDQNNVVGNSVTSLTTPSSVVQRFQEGITVTGSGNLLNGNTAVDSIGDGIHVLTSGNTLVANVANDNGTLGIEAGPGVIDGGLNRASGNGNPIQCLNIDCSGLPVAHVPASPTGLTASPGNGSVALSWQPNLAGDAVVHYNVYRTDQSFSGAWATPLATAFTNASDVVNGTRYCYQVSATNSRGESARSATVCATPTGPAAPPPATLTGPATPTPPLPPPTTPGGHGLASSHQTPRLTGMSLATTTFRAAKSGASLLRRGPAGVLLTFRLSQPATVTFRVQRKRTIHGHTRWVTLPGSFSWASPAGTTRLRFTGRIAGKKLPPGRYRLVLTPHANAGNAAAPIRSSPFTITQ